MKALIIFDGRLHLEAAKALEQLEGKVLPGCHSWQKIKCQQLFHTSLSCQVSVYIVIQKQLDSLLASFRHLKGNSSCAYFLFLYGCLSVTFFFLIFRFSLFGFLPCCKS